MSEFYSFQIDARRFFFLENFEKFEFFFNWAQFFLVFFWNFQIFKFLNFFVLGKIIGLTKSFFKFHWIDLKSKNWLIQKILSVPKNTTFMNKTYVSNVWGDKRLEVITHKMQAIDASKEIPSRLTCKHQQYIQSRGDKLYKMWKCESFEKKNFLSSSSSSLTSCLTIVLFAIFVNFFFVYKNVRRAHHVLPPSITTIFFPLSLSSLSICGAIVIIIKQTNDKSWTKWRREKK